MNQLIELLPRKDRLCLLAVCQRVPLEAGEMLYEQGSRALHAYFPVDGFIALVMPVDAHAGVGVALVGRDSMLGAPMALGLVTAPLRALVQAPGSAWRIGRNALRREHARSVALRRLLHACVAALLGQLASATACLHWHAILPRLARWLLMSQDCSAGNGLQLTHEMLAALLGVRRVGITLAAGVLQRQGLIEYRRGQLTVLDRSGLHAAACSCYAAPAAPLAPALCGL